MTTADTANLDCYVELVTDIIDQTSNALDSEKTSILTPCVKEIASSNLSDAFIIQEIFSEHGWNGSQFSKPIESEQLRRDLLNYHKRYLPQPEVKSFQERLEAMLNTIEMLMRSKAHPIASNNKLSSVAKDITENSFKYEANKTLIENVRKVLRDNGFNGSCFTKTVDLIKLKRDIICAKNGIYKSKNYV